MKLRWIGGVHSFSGCDMRGLNQDCRVVPSRQIVIVLTSRLEVETTNGEVRRWGALGDAFDPLEWTRRDDRVAVELRRVVYPSLHAEAT